MQNISAQSERCSSTSTTRNESHVGLSMGPLWVAQEGAVEVYEKRTGFSGTGTITVENGYIISVTNKRLARSREHATGKLAELLCHRGVL